MFLGAKFHPNFGTEIGYDGTMTAHATNPKKYFEPRKYPHSELPQSLYQDTEVLGSRTSLQLRNWYWNLNTYLPLNDRADLIGIVGVNYSKPLIKTLFPLEESMSVEGQLYFPEDGGIYRPGIEVADTDLALKQWKSKAVFYPVLGLGLQYRLTNTLSLKISAKWENSSRVSAENKKIFRDNLSASASILTTF